MSQSSGVDDANRVATECLYAGGKGIDVSRAIRHLGSDSMALGFIGGHNGQIMLDLHAGGKTLEDCARFATAAGTAATLAPGNQLCRLRDVQRLAARVRLEHIRS